jgi:hypothetical protein
MKRSLFILFALMNTILAQEVAQTHVVTVDHQLRREIFADASKLSGYPVPETLPEIRRVSHRFIVQITCGGEECARYAATMPGIPIWIDETLELGLVADYSWVLHEAIHVLQFAAKGITDINALSCEEGLALEKEAYHLQQKYLDQHKALLRVTRGIDRVSCPTSSE